jgi:uncharacterized membrane protein YgdD (TMEM256/DUF423 family)
MIVARLVLASGALTAGAGIGLLALAAHAGVARLESAAQMLALHGVALCALASAIALCLVEMRTALAAAILLGAGPILFAADIMARWTSGERLFVMAAPIGGTLAITGWGVLALAALLPVRRGR